AGRITLENIGADVVHGVDVSLRRPCPQGLGVDRVRLVDAGADVAGREDARRILRGCVDRQTGALALHLAGVQASDAGCGHLTLLRRLLIAVRIFRERRSTPAPAPGNQGDPGRQNRGSESARYAGRAGPST